MLLCSAGPDQIRKRGGGGGGAQSFGVSSCTWESKLSRLFSEPRNLPPDPALSGLEFLLLLDVQHAYSVISSIDPSVLIYIMYPAWRVTVYALFSTHNSNEVGSWDTSNLRHFGPGTQWPWGTSERAYPVVEMATLSSQDLISKCEPGWNHISMLTAIFTMMIEWDLLLLCVICK